MSFQANLKKAGNYFKNKNVLITGGNGFIGTHLASALVSAGANLKVLDLKKNPANKNIKQFCGSILDKHLIERALKSIDIVFHYAALIGVEKIYNIPREVLKVNFEGTKVLLDSSVKAGVKKFIFASSSEIYGNPCELPLSEVSPKAPISTYGISKLASEEYCSIFSLEYNIIITIIRHFNVYGPLQKESFVISNFIRNVMKNKPPVIYGNGNQSRCYTYITDAVNGILLASGLKAGENEIFNIGTDERISILKLAEIIIRHSNKNLAPEYKKFGDGIRVENREILDRQPNISKAEKKLSYKVNTSLHEGIKLYCKWLLENKKAQE